MLADTRKQLIYYQSGIGTYGGTLFSPFGVVKTAEKLLDEAFGLDLKQHVVDAYAFLSNYFEPGQCPERLSKIAVLLPMHALLSLQEIASTSWASHAERTLHAR